jgi:hypothetical protein
MTVKKKNMEYASPNSLFAKTPRLGARPSVAPRDTTRTNGVTVNPSRRSASGARNGLRPNAAPPTRRKMSTVIASVPKSKPDQAMNGVRSYRSLLYLV